VKVLPDLTGGSSAMLIVGIYYAAMNGADVINMSLGGYYTQSGWVVYPANPSRSFFVGAKAIAAHVNAHKWATEYAHWRGATLIASAGNHAIDRDHVADLIHLPSDLPQVIQVSATGPSGWKLNLDTNLDLSAPYTDYGQSAIDLAAPGGLSPQPHPTRSYWPLDPSINPPDWAFDLVLVADHSGGWSWVSGTSFSAPHVADVAALIIGANGGSMHPDQVRSILERSADDLGKPGNDDFYAPGESTPFGLCCWRSDGFE
jgi:lantibiotic leader peptide-processing serine protease